MREFDVRQEKLKFDGEILGVTVFSPRCDECPSVIFAVGNGSLTGPLRLNYRYLWPIAEHFAKKGIEVIYPDRPGTCNSSGDWRLETLFDRADQLVEIAKCFQGSNRRLGFFGHSNGGWASVVAGTLEPPDFIVAAATPLVRPEQQLIFSLVNSLKNKGLHADKVKHAAEYRSLHFRSLILLRDGRRTEFKSLREELLRLRKSEPLLALWDYLPALPSWNHRWDLLRSMEAHLDFEPVKYFERVECPMFLAFGQSDEIVDVEESRLIFEGLSSNSNDSTLRIYANMNHRLQEGDDESAIWCPVMLDEITGWILRQ